MRIKVPAILILSLVLIFPQTGILFADEKKEELAPIEVRASRSNIPAHLAASSITVITSAEIKRSQHQRVEDILRETLGADVVRNGPPGSNSSLFMRGTGSASTLVMIDGMQVNSNTQGAFDFRDLSLDNVEQVEILRGPQSTLWGANAVGGVINIVTKRGKGTPSHFAAFEGGSYATFKETVGSSGEINDFDYSVTASRTDSGGFSAANKKNGNTEDDGYGASNISTRLGYNFLNDGRAEIVSRYIKSVSDFDSFSSAAGRVADGSKNQHNHIETVYLAAPIQKSLTNWWDIKLNPYLSYDALESVDPPSTSHIFNRNYAVDFQNNLSFGKYYSATAGVDYKALNGHNVEQKLSKDIYQQGYFLQGQFNHEDRLLLTGGFRHDVNSVYQDKTTYKFEGAYRFIDYGTKLRAAKATGFRAPSLNDLFFPNASNPNLKPEESDSWEVGIEQEFLQKRVLAGITYFDSDLTNLIQFDLATFSPQNVGEATSRGTESFIKFRILDNLDINLNHTWNEALDSAGAPLRRRARNKFNASIHHNWNDKLDSTVGLFYKSGIRDGAANASDYATIRAAFSYQLLKDLKFTARGENLLDKKYEEIPSFGTAGVSGYAGFIYNFQ